MKRITSILVVAALLLLTSGALAMESTNYALDWFTPLTSGGGGSSSSTIYTVNFTIGQTAIGASNSANYAVGLGYWYGIRGCRIFLPIVQRN
jgi:hypothetical protein